MRLLLPGTLALILAVAGCGRAAPPHDADSSSGPAHRDAQADEHEHEEEHGGDEAHADDAGHVGADPHDEGHDEHGHQSGGARIAADTAREHGIVVAPAAPGVIRDAHDVQGLLTFIEGRHARIAARFAGPVRRVDVSVGDSVAQGQVLALVESNASLSNYSITAPFAGVVLARNAADGEMAGDEPLFEIADLSQLWVDLHVFGADATHLRAGLPVTVTRLADGASIDTTIDRVLPATATRSQSSIARAVIDNEDGAWRPGSAVRARVTVAEQAVELRVPLSALQRMDGADVVFVAEGEVYEPRQLWLGRRDSEYVEVLHGLDIGEPVVVEQSFLLKADIEKAGAAHEH
jgi:cobalt-zinc-cadmium efflux system membrane fusion protein